MKKSLCLITTLAGISGPLLSLPVQASTLADAVAECRQQQNALKRLVCYDEIELSAKTLPATNNAVQAHSQAPVRPAPVSNDPATARAAPTDPDFGLEHKKPVEKEADQLYLTVSKISYSPRKELIVEFDNGQIWRQNDSSYYAIEVGEQHYIKRGLFNSFILGNDDNNRTIKVRRIE
ncbi:hypothetical protein [Arsukibacterium sp.]|uniref:hypothetical protein n=1 Tax=Arsukibacterium sp. TaxID=1977258 RepID=UPI00299D1886|nr:hypothetical protein [Arsukibacterium sp.]MDX1678985.1 hypothetical protein [Arsukibacterium sp.]